MLSLKESIFKHRSIQVPLLEGIDVDVIAKTVKFTDAHEELVDTSLSNPTYTDEGIKVISVFKRKKSSTELISDGNPLVYALKGKSDWQISSDDAELMWNRVDDILKKIKNEYDVVVLSPSSNGLVSVFAQRIKEALNNIEIIEDCLLKLTKEEIIELSPFKGFSEEELEQMERALKRMDYWFEAKHMNKKLLSKLSDNLTKLNPAHNYLHKIYNKRVLLIDDVYSSGSTLKSCNNSLLSLSPSNITNLVMFSGV